VSTFDDVNQRFHEAYDEARAAVGERTPVLIVLEDSMILRRGDQRFEVVVTPPLFHVIKSVAHAPLALFSLLHHRPAGPIDGQLQRALTQLQQSLAKSTAALSDGVIADGDSDNRDVAARLCGLLQATGDFIAPLVHGAAHDPTHLTTFARARGPALLGATADATRLQLAALNRALGQILGRLSAHERQTFEVVVAGAHQARARSLAMQYFGKLFGEQPGAEQRLVYAENISDEAEAIALTATRQLDRALAGAFFGDPRRLQRDVLGDSVHEQLATLPLPSL
jgi:hypothetical protein